MPNAQLMPRPERALVRRRTAGLGDGPSVTLPPNPEQQYQQYQTPQGQAQIKSQAQTSIVTFAQGIAAWAGGGPKPALPSQENIGAIAASVALASGSPQVAGAIMLGFSQAALEREVFDAVGAPTWAVVLAASVGGDIGAAINLAYGALTSIWGSSGCPTPGPPSCAGTAPPSGPSDPAWKSIQGDCDYVHAAWMLADIQSCEAAAVKDAALQFRYLFDQILFVLWTNAINCKMPPPSDRDVLLTLAAQWNEAHGASSSYTWQPVAIAPGGQWYDPPNPTYLQWCLSGGPSGYNMSSIYDAGPIIITTGALDTAPSPTTGGGAVVPRTITTGASSSQGLSTGAKVAVGTAAVAAAAAGGVGIWAWLTHQAYSAAWRRVWDETGGRAWRAVQGK